MKNIRKRANKIIADAPKVVEGASDKRNYRIVEKNTTKRTCAMKDLQEEWMVKVTAINGGERLYNDPVGVWLYEKGRKFI